MNVGLSVSNIAWDSSHDEEVYSLMKDLGYSGLEIAPTRLFPQNPYDCLKEAEKFAGWLYSRYGFVIPSMQSIWYGRTENMFESEQAFQILLDYTKKAIDFASAIGCGNLVFGCPRNRNMPAGASADIASRFFLRVGEYAEKNNTVVAMEANPPIYNTNFINTTSEAVALVKKVGSNGFRLNLDMGTIIENNEHCPVSLDDVSLINHIHISEPGLVKPAHYELCSAICTPLINVGYSRFISVEMGMKCGLDNVMDALRCTAGYFREGQ